MRFFVNLLQKRKKHNLQKILQGIKNYHHSDVESFKKLYETWDHLTIEEIDQIYVVIDHTLMKMNKEKMYNNHYQLLKDVLIIHGET